MQLVGYIDKKMNQNYKTGKADFYLLTKEQSIHCQGILPYVKPGVCVELSGDYNEKSQILYFTTYHFITDTAASKQFIQSLKIKKMTEEDIDFFVTFFNNDLFAAIKDSTSKLQFIERLPKKQQKFGDEIYRKAKLYFLHEEVFQYVMIHGGIYENVIRIIDKYGDESLRLLQQYPYMVGFHTGLPFYICDQIAKENGYTNNSEARLNQILYQSIQLFLDRGDSYCEKEDLFKVIDRVLRKSPLGLIEHDFLEARIYFHPDFMEYGTKVTLKKVYRIEQSIAENVMRIARHKKPLPYNEEYVSEVEKLCNITLDDSQRNSFNALRTTGIKIVNGGPGSGKTTTVNALIKYIEEYYHPSEPITLCAPTGCASQNMAAKTHHVAQTIHKTLDYRPFGDNAIVKDLEGKFFIVDELSMLDEELAHLFFGAVPTESLIILVGDVDQLPSVGYGNVLQDLYNCSFIETYTLHGTHRQAEDSAIVTNAKKINQQDTDLLLEEKDFTVLSVETAEEVEILGLSALENLKESICLCPMKKYDAGTYAINKKYCPNKNRAEKLYGDFTYHVNDKVIMTKNDYKIGFHNGDFGVITGVDEDGMNILLDIGTEIYLQNSALNEVALAYAITIHKSQGGEYDEVILLLTKKALRFADKRILYTAVTRAKKYIYIISEKNTLEQLILKSPRPRKTRLGEFLALYEQH